jgi:hypothetical protein
MTGVGGVGGEVVMAVVVPGAAVGSTTEGGARSEAGTAEKMVGALVGVNAGEIDWGTMLIAEVNVQRSNVYTDHHQNKRSNTIY